jgi:DNA repair exonuclease SbcCD ATPase subunit
MTKIAMLTGALLLAFHGALPAAAQTGCASECARLTEANQALTRKVATLENDLAAHKAELSELKRQLAAEIADAKTQNDSRHNALKSQMDAAQSSDGKAELAEVKKLLAELAEARSLSDTRYNALKSQIDAARVKFGDTVTNEINFATSGTRAGYRCPDNHFLMSIEAELNETRAPTRIIVKCMKISS